MNEGARRIQWVAGYMPLLARLNDRLREERPFQGMTIGICLHIEPKTAVMCHVLQAGGAKIAITGSPGTTQDDVASALRHSGCQVYGRHPDSVAEHAANIRKVLENHPDIFLDNGAGLVECYLSLAHPHTVIGGTEETTTGAIALREKHAGSVSFPIIVINDSPLKLIMENEYGVGPTVASAFLTVTNLQISAKRFAVFGYGSVGRGIAKNLQAQHGRVTVVEPDPVRSLEAILHGTRVTNREKALRDSEVLITATGRAGVITIDDVELLRDGAILVNAGHHSWEIDVEGIRARAMAAEHVSDRIEILTMPDGKRLTLLTRGEMLNLAGESGNPVETMDLGLTLQVLSLRRIALEHERLQKGPQAVPDDINREVAQGMVEFLSRE